MDTFKSILISILFFFILSTQAIGQTKSSYEIPLQSGTIILKKGEYDTGSLRTMESMAEENNYVIVQFEKALKRKKIKELEKLGIILLSFLHKNAWICSVNASSLSETEMKKYAIAAMTPWKAEYKILPELKKGHFQEWAITESGNVKLLVSSFRDVDTKVVERLLAQYSSAYEILSTPNIWVVELAPDNIEKLINEPAVHYVEEGSKSNEQRLMFCICLSLLSPRYKL